MLILVFIYVEKHVDNVIDQLDRDFMEITRKLERIKSAKASKFSFIEECLREGSVLKKGKAIKMSIVLNVYFHAYMFIFSVLVCLIYVS